MSLIRAAIACTLYFTYSVAAAGTEAWKSRSIYFALTDRIARSSSDTGGSACSDLGNYCGGTFQGLEGKLDYIKGLGFDSVWITPVVANSAGGYHGYWAQDLYSINSNYGTADDLKSLVSTAHSKGMYVMVDVVANHMGQGAIANNSPSLLSQASSYHTNCDINYNNQTSVEVCRIASLPDLNQSIPEVADLLNTWISWLVKEYAFDGVRIDTVKHVHQDFWPDFANATGTYSIGEVFDGDPNYVAPYAKLMPGVLDYLTYYPMNRFYQQSSSGSVSELVSMMDTIASTFPDPAALGTFLDNHDNPRWLNTKNDQTLLKNALAFVILSRGIPILYYGTEQGYSGGADPANREDLWRSNFNTNTDLYQAIQKLTSARKNAGGLGGNDHVHLLTSASNAYAWSRANGNLIVLTTNAGSSSNQQYCFNSQKPNGQWTDTFSGSSTTVTADSNGQICLTVSNGNPIVLLATASSSPSLVTRIASSAQPTATNIACPTAVAVTFSERITTVPGDTIKIVGNTTQLGSWNPSSAPSLSASSYTASNPVWTITLNIPAGSSFQYKFVKVSSSGTASWESDPNRSYTASGCQATMSVSSSWQ